MTMNRRRLFVCGEDDKVMGLAPWDAEVGDLICVLFGCKHPVVIRRQPTDSGTRVNLVGETFVENFMDGEAINMLRDGQLRAQDFEIC